MTETATRVLTFGVPSKEFAAVQNGDLRMLIIPTQLNWAENDEINVVELNADSQPTGKALLARVTYVTSADSPCALSPVALNPAFAVASITLVK